MDRAAFHTDNFGANMSISEVRDEGVWNVVTYLVSCSTRELLERKVAKMETGESEIDVHSSSSTI